MYRFFLASVLMMNMLNSAKALEGEVVTGLRFTNITLGMGTATSGFNLLSNWLIPHYDSSYSYSGLSLGYNVKIGSVLLSPKAKIMMIHPHNLLIPLVGGGVEVPVTERCRAYAEYAFFSSTAFRYGSGFYHEMMAGGSFTPFSIPILALRTGYQHMAFRDNAGRKGTLASFFYIGASIYI